MHSGAAGHLGLGDALATIAHVPPRHAGRMLALGGNGSGDQHGQHRVEIGCAVAPIGSAEVEVAAGQVDRAALCGDPELFL